MFRRGRRPLRRAWTARRTWAQSPLAASARRELVRANRLMEIGDFTNAAVLYSQLARKLHDLGHPRQAAHLYIQAARAKTLSGQLQPAQEFFQQGLSIFADVELWESFEHIGSRILVELRQQGHGQTADALSRWMQIIRQNQSPTPPGGSKPLKPQNPPLAQGSLPLKCPSCGATVRSDEVQWIDDRHAECGYCGSTLEAE
jgi:DNA-directed RNA polymerase subunit RPC12/RpoP